MADINDSFQDALKREITDQEIENILLKYAFIQISNLQAQGGSDEKDFLHSRSGWSIINYKNLISASPGELLFTDGKYVETEAGELERVCSGIGTRVKQIMDTAADVVKLAVEQEHWPSIHIEDGNDFMAWAIWYAAQEYGIQVTGFVPTKEELDRAYRIRQKEQNEPPTAKP